MAADGAIAVARTAGNRQFNRRQKRENRSSKQGRDAANVDSATATRETLEHCEVLAAVNSLYADCVEPLDHHVRRRIEELTGTRWTPERLISAAQTAPGIHIEEETSRSRRWLYMTGRTANFVDQTSPHDPYPAALWQELQDIVSDPEVPWADVQASSRYDVAKTLREWVPGLKAYTLGEVCHVVHLAIRVHRILGYRDGRIVPHKESLDAEKLANASSRVPTGQPGSEKVVTSWSEARDILKELIAEHADASGIELSTLKTRIRNHFGRDLNETVLGHTKLSALIKDPHFTRVCRAEVRGSEVYLCPAPRGPRRQPRGRRKPRTRVPSLGNAATSCDTCLSSAGGDAAALPSSCSGADPDPYANVKRTLPMEAADRGNGFGPGSGAYGKFQHTVVYEPVISWRAHVVRTFIEFPDPARARGARREQSSPPRLEACEYACILTPISSRASSEVASETPIPNEANPTFHLQPVPAG